MSKAQKWPLSPQQTHLCSLGLQWGWANCRIRLADSYSEADLAAAAERVVARHQILRTHLVQDDQGRWFQVLREQAKLKVQRGEARTLPENSLQGSILLTIEEQDLGCLLHCHLPAYASDAKGLRCFAMELLEILAGEPGREGVAAQYAGSTELLNQMLEEKSTYWDPFPQEALPRLPLTREVVGKNLIKSHAFNKGGIVPMPLPEGYVPEYFLFCCWRILLWHLLAEPLHHVAMCMPGRPCKEYDNVPGLYARYLPSLTPLVADESFDTFYQKVTAALQEASTHQHTLARQEGHSFYLGFDYHPPQERGAARVAGSDVIQEHFQLRLSCTHGLNRLQAFFHYESGHFTAQEMDLLEWRFLTLASSITASPLASMATYSLMSEQEREMLLKHFQGGAQKHEDTLPARLDAMARTSPNQPALESNGSMLTYAQLQQAVERLASLLLCQGVRPLDRLGVCYSSGQESIVSIWAIFKVGAIYVPLDIAALGQSLSWVLVDADISLLLCECPEQLPPLPPSVHLFQDVLPECMPATTSFVALDPCFPAYLRYAKITNKGRGVLLRHSSLCNEALSCAALFQIDADARVSQIVPPSHAAAILEITIPLCVGATLVIVPEQKRLSGNELSLFINQEVITHVFLQPTLLLAMDEMLPFPRTIICGGQACASELAMRWGNDRSFFNTYGCTEARVMASAGGQLAAGETPPIGKPLVNVQTYVVDGHLNLRLIGQSGELVCASDNLALGYHNRPMLTAERFVPNPFGRTPGDRLFRSGDQVRFLEDGQLFFIGQVQG